MSTKLNASQTWIEVDYGQLEKNARIVVDNVAPRKLIAVIKSNAYGHGFKKSALAFIKGGASYLAVFAEHEHHKIRKFNIETPVIILGLVNEIYLNNIDLNTHLVVSHPTWFNHYAKWAQKHSKKINIHLKLDTGMSRFGLTEGEAQLIISASKNLPNLKITGLMTHFASADSDLNLFNKQLNRWNNAKANLSKLIEETIMLHSANSAATTIHNIDDDAVRVGLALYGHIPKTAQPWAKKLSPALTWKTQIVQLKNVPAGETIGYDGTFTQQTTGHAIGLIPVGYSDGLDRALSNQKAASINGTKVEFAGRISMNCAALDLKKVPSPRIGDIVVLLSNKRSDVLGAAEIGRMSQRIPYEVFTSLGGHIIRNNVTS